MDKLLGAVSYIGEIKLRSDDDAVDRLNHNYTVGFLILFAVLVSTRQYVGEPINCWVPAQFTHNHEEYTNKVCWVSNTYYLPFKEKKIPTDGKDMIGYYQWIPMILIVQALMFYIPCLVWRLLSKRSGISVKTVTESALNSSRVHSGETRDRTIRYLSNHLDSYLSVKRQENNSSWARIKKLMAKKCLFIAGRVYGNYLTVLYLFIKLLYVANCVGQLFLLNVFLGTQYHMFGVYILMSLVQGHDWKSSTRFPRVTLCDFEVRQLGNIHRHTVQCVLPINLFNEKIFVFIWFWFVLVAIVTVISLLSWTRHSLSTSGQVEYVTRQLKALDKLNRETRSQVRKFTRKYLKQDGIFVVRLVAKSAGEVVAAEILAGLWDKYKRETRLVVDGLGPPQGVPQPTTPILMA